MNEISNKVIIASAIYKYKAYRYSKSVIESNNTRNLKLPGAAKKTKQGKWVIVKRIPSRTQIEARGTRTLM